MKIETKIHPKWNKITDKLPEHGQAVCIISKDKFDCFPKAYSFINNKCEYKNGSFYMAQYFEDFNYCVTTQLYLDEVLYWIDKQELEKTMDNKQLFVFLGINED